MDRKKILARVLLAVWVFIWALFLIRPYLKKDLLKTYRELAPLSLEEKHSYVTGKELYGFIMACKDLMPPGSTYSIVGLENDPLGFERSSYYLYPAAISKDPDFILAYNKEGYIKDGYRIFKSFSVNKYMLKKEK